ncbi:MAG: hypothetical protein ACK5HL_02670 [Bacilli bacterium]
MKKIINIILIFLILIITYELLTESQNIITSIRFACDIWINSIFPSLFPFFVVSEILVNLGLPDFLGELFKNISNKLFKISGQSAFIIIMSLISGFPSSGKYTKELYENKVIDENEASKILMFTHFSNPLFISATICTIFLDNINVAWIIFLSHYLSNFIIGILVRNFHPSKLKKEKISLKNAFNSIFEKRRKSNESFGTILTNSILNSISTLFNILGVISIFLALTTLIKTHIDLSPIWEAILSGLFEMTHGIKEISLLNISLNLKIILSTMLISFGGFSVHMQIYSIISDTKIKYWPFLCGRIMHFSFSGIICFLIFSFI